MIRVVTPMDINELAAFIRSEDKGFEGDLLAEIKTESKRVLTYEVENQIKGFAFATLSINEEHGNEANIKVYVTPSVRRRGIGTELYKKLLKQLEEENPDVLIAFMRVDIEDPSPFLKKFGFTKWWGTPELIFKGSPFKDSNLEFHQYEDKCYEQYRRIKNECYYEIQKSNDLKPFNLPYSDEERKNLLNNRVHTYLVLNGDEIVASVTIGDGEIDNLMVNPAYQGKGYGRKAMQFAMNKMLDTGYEEIHICYMEGNNSAEKLYFSLGFKPLQKTHVYRKILKA